MYNSDRDYIYYIIKIQLIDLAYSTNLAHKPRIEQPFGHKLIL